MANKHTDKVGTYEDFRAPWETEGGEDAEINKASLKRLIYNLKAGEAKALDQRDENSETIKVVEKERDEAKEEVKKASPDEANRKIAKLEQENADLKAAADAREKADAHEALRKEVLGDLDPKYAKYVTGDDKKALEESLEAVKADFGLEDGNSEEESDEDDDRPTLRTRPRSLVNGGDPAGPEGGAGGEVDFDKAADQILVRGPFG
jgi:hypothetical protein